MVPHMQVGHGQLPRTRRRGHRSTHPAEIGTDMVRRMSGCCSDPPHALGNASKRKARPSPSASSPNERKRAKPTGAESDAGSMGSTIPYPPAPSKTSSNSTIAYSPAPSNESSDEEEPLPKKKWGRGEKTLSVSLRLTLNELPQEICIPPLHGARLARKLSLL